MVPTAYAKTPPVCAPISSFHSSPWVQCWYSGPSHSLCEQQRLWAACANAQADLRLNCSLVVQRTVYARRSIQSFDCSKAQSIDHTLNLPKYDIFWINNQSSQLHITYNSGHPIYLRLVGSLSRQATQTLVFASFFNKGHRRRKRGPGPPQ